MAAGKVTTARYNDFIYDPLFIVSGEKDYYKAAMVAQMSSAKFAICPIFPSMFSDLPHQQRQLSVMRRPPPVPEFVSRCGTSPECGKRPIDVGGTDRHKFFRSPAIHLKEVKLTPLTLPTPVPTPRKEPKKPKKRSKKIQTQYRESSAQTYPWQPSDYIVMDEGDPELLMLSFLKWGSGLPVGMHEVRLIERARMKRAWEKTLPPVTDAASLEKRRQLIEAMERDEWAFREQEIQDIHDLRLELLERMLNELHEKSKYRTEMKVKMFTKAKLAEKEEKLKKLRHNTEREMRKLKMKHNGVKRFYGPVDIIEEHANRTSELYGPLMRHGQHPKRWHQVIDEHLKKYRAQFLGVEDISTLPRWLDQATKMKDCVCIKLPGTRLCMRETKWTTPVLKELHEGLKNLRKTETRRCTLMVKLEKGISELTTPEVENGDDWEEELHQASIMIESVLRGRASQVLIFEGRDRCRELIQELRSTHALQEEDRIQKFERRLEVKSQQRQHVICNKNRVKLQENLSKLSGNIVGTLLDFLNKELRRLMDERKAHAMCLLFERERHIREAAEAGRRQAEERRRLEHDEIFKQIVKVNQDTVDLYLEDIITEGMEFASHEEAHHYIELLANRIDDETYATHNKINQNEKEELIANLVHNFLLPEVEKQMVRDTIKQKQHNYLKVAHEAIYNKIEDLPKPPPKPFQAKKSRISTTEKAAPSRADQDSIGKAVCVRGFQDLNLPETKSVSSVEDMNVIFTADEEEQPASEVCSVMEFLKNKEDKPIHKMKLKKPMYGLGSSDDAEPVDLIPAETNLDLRTLGNILEKPASTQPHEKEKSRQVVIRTSDDKS